ncbi:MAG: hypothetical protein CMP48_25160 [Rickettsiales bacterium]|nr:hypothetical protein [Rickettsiales bacterium]
MLDMQSNDRTWGTLWLKKKTKKIRKGDKKGEEIEIMMGSVHIGGGKMLKVECYPNQSTVTSDKGDELMALSVSKWKGDAPQKRGQGRGNKSW